MQSDDESQRSAEFSSDMPITAEEVGFKPEELVNCPKCSRPGPPNRLKCLYCGTELELTAEQSAKIAPVLRKLEDWEMGFNLIFTPDGKETSEESRRAFGKVLALADDFVSGLFSAAKPLPIARAESLSEAAILADRLLSIGIATRIFGDEELNVGTAPKRLRGIEFHDGRIILIHFNNDEIEEFDADQIRVIVIGSIFEKAVEATEVRKKGQTKILDASETASDEVLFDFYVGGKPLGYRILTKGFDFSCLGSEKGILSRDNLSKLASKLKSLSPAAVVVDDYLRQRSLLGAVWEIEQRRDSKGLMRQRFGKFDMGHVSSSSNLAQFTKYSRLQMLLFRKTD